MLVYLTLVIKICNIVMLFKTLSSCLLLPLCLKTVDTWTMWVCYTYMWIFFNCKYYSTYDLWLNLWVQRNCGYREWTIYYPKINPCAIQGSTVFKTIIYAGISYIFQEKKWRCCILQKNRTFIFLKFIIFLCSLGTF